METKNRIIDNLRFLMEKRGIVSLRQLAELSGVPVSTVTRAFKPEQDTNIAKYEAITEALGVPFWAVMAADFKEIDPFSVNWSTVLADNQRKRVVAQLGAAEDIEKDINTVINLCWPNPEQITASALPMVIARYLATRRSSANSDQQLSDLTAIMYHTQRQLGGDAEETSEL